jgi:hypothetical protein
MAALTTALIALQAVNTGAQFLSSRRAASGLERQANYEADVLGLNANQADAQRKDALTRGQQAEHQSRNDTRALIGAQRAALGASGVDISTGSAVDVQADAAGIGELEALTIRNNARREAYGYEVDALNLRTRAAMTRVAGRNQASGLRDAATSTLLTGALSTYGTYAASRVPDSPGTIREAAKIGRRFAGAQLGVPY